MTYVKIDGVRYPATISGHVSDRDWGGRRSKIITLEMDYNDALALFVDNLAWYIVLQDETIIDPDTGEEFVPKHEIYDNSSYCVAGDIIDHRNGYISVKMGEKTELELMQAQLANAVTEDELTNAYIEGVNSL